jgi:DNA-binding IclR family transcriptional regulator
VDQVASFGRPVRFSGAASPVSERRYRSMQTLSNQDMLAFDPDRGTYAPACIQSDCACGVTKRRRACAIATHLDRLECAVGETVHLARLDATGDLRH